MHDNLISAFEALARENPRATIRYCRVGSLEEIALGDCDSTWHGRYRELAHKAANAFNIPRGFRGWLWTVHKNHPADGPARKGRAMVDGKSVQMAEEELPNAAGASAFVMRLLAIDADAGAKGTTNSNAGDTKPENEQASNEDDPIVQLTDTQIDILRGLRHKRGQILTLTAIERATADAGRRVSRKTIAKEMPSLLKHNLVREEGGRYAITPRGLEYLNPRKP